jgi:metal-responsive CopG/Arc/MetJ family transcriptional regulator
MPVKDSNMQIAVILPKDIVKIIDDMAKEDGRTRSQAAGRIIIKYINSVQQNKEE